MTNPALPSQTAAEIAADLLRLSPAYAPTPLLDLPELAAQLGVARVLAKAEGERMLGSFKSLGGTYAGLRALARVSRLSMEELLGAEGHGAALPPLICASDGNHGLAVAAAARFAGSAARIYLHAGVPQSRAARIATEGAEIVWIPGTYDDAVDAAAEASRRGDGILVADTTEDPNDSVVADVVAGYGVMAAEIRDQVAATGDERPTHLFVQAGVGGLAAAMAEGLAGWMAAPAAIVVVEPDGVACVGAALTARRAVRLAGTLETSAEMLACGAASAPALATLLRYGARAVSVSEAELAASPARLRSVGGPATTPSGAAGLAGLLRVALDPSSRVLILITEGDI